jgi:hypothetical protein
MRLPGKGRDSFPVDVRKVALTALAAALEDGRQTVKDDKKGLTGARAVATGAVLVTAGRAAYKGTRFVRERLRSDEEPAADEEFEDEEYEDEPEAEAEEGEEPEAEADEDFEDEEPEAEEDEEPEAEEDEEPEAEEDEEPEAEEDEEPEAEEDEEPEAEEDEEPEAEADEGPDSEDRPSDLDEGRPPIFDRPLGRRGRARPSSRPPKRSDGSALEPPPRPSRSRAPVGRT